MEHAPTTTARCAAYRNQFELSARRWQSEHVRGYVLALSRQLVAAEAQGWHRVVGDIERLFARCEPLHEIAYQDYGCSLLWIAYNWYCARDIDTTRNAIRYAQRQWPEEEELARMLERAEEQQKEPTSYLAGPHDASSFLHINQPGDQPDAV